MDTLSTPLSAPSSSSSSSSSSRRAATDGGPRKRQRLRRDDSPTHVMTAILDDTAVANITYSPGFMPCHNNLNDRYYEGTLHCTKLEGETATIEFYGTGVTVVGAISDNHGQYTTQLDDGALATTNGNAPHFTPGQTLYSASALLSGRHTVTLTNADQGWYFDIDQVFVYDVPEGGAGASSTAEPAAQSAAPSASASALHASRNAALAPAAVAGLVIGLVLLLALLAGALVFLRRRTREHHERARWSDQTRFGRYARAHSRPGSSADMRALGAGVLGDGGVQRLVDKAIFRDPTPVRRLSQPDGPAGFGVEVLPRYGSR